MLFCTCFYHELDPTMHFIFKASTVFENRLLKEIFSWHLRSSKVIIGLLDVNVVNAHQTEPGYRATVTGGRLEAGTSIILTTLCRCCTIPS